MPRWSVPECPDCGTEMDLTHDMTTDYSYGETHTCPECGREEIRIVNTGQTTSRAGQFTGGER